MMKIQVKCVAIIWLCSALGLAQAQTNPRNPVDNAVIAGGANNAEMNRVFDDQDKKVKAIRPYFSNTLADAQDFILAGKLDKAKKPIEKLHGIANLNVYEAARLYLIDSWYFGGTGELAKETAALINLMPIGADTIEADAFVIAGMRLLKRQYNSQDYAGAIETLGHLRKVSESGPELLTVLTAVNKLDGLVAGDQNITSQITADEQGVWRSSLLRPSLYLDKITGTVISVELDCANKKINIPYAPDSAITVPASWGACKITINSTPGASYSVIQTIAKPAA
jgi:hypothetical protein